jgi:hypothetical protein
MLVTNAADLRPRLQTGVLGGRAEPAFLNAFDQAENIHRFLDVPGLFK